MTAEPCRAKDRPLHSPSNLFRPRRNPPLPRLGSRLHERAWVEAPGTAPGSEELISTPFIAIAAQGGAANISIMAHFSNGKPNRDETGGAHGDKGPTEGGFLGFGGERVSDAEKEVLAQISPTLGLAA